MDEIQEYEEELNHIDEEIASLEADIQALQDELDGTRQLRKEVEDWLKQAKEQSDGSERTS